MNKAKYIRWFLAALLPIFLAQVGCSPSAASTVEATPSTPPSTATVPSEIKPTAAQAGKPLPADPRPVEIRASDGEVLEGLYYPASAVPAPVVVLMHWAGGDMHDWDAIAPWLQNRGQSAGKGSGSSWLDSSWFPPLPKDRSYAVLIFNFRPMEFKEFKAGSTSPLILDAEAAMQAARKLEGADPSRVAAIGASIGADAAADACKEGCVGAFSLSPGDYLGLAYKNEVARLGESVPPVPVVCLSSKGDLESARACQSADGGHYSALSYEGKNHGMQLIQPSLQPPPLQLILDFLARVFG